MFCFRLATTTWIIAYVYLDATSVFMSCFRGQHPVKHRSQKLSRGVQKTVVRAFSLQFSLIKDLKLAISLLDVAFLESFVRCFQNSFFLCFSEIHRSGEMLNSTAEDCDMAECQSPEEEGQVRAAADSEGGSAVSYAQDVPKESNSTSSPDTDSPVMINVDVSLGSRLCVSPKSC